MVFKAAPGPHIRIGDLNDPANGHDLQITDQFSQLMFPGCFVSLVCFRCSFGNQVMFHICEASARVHKPLRPGLRSTTSLERRRSTMRTEAIAMKTETAQRLPRKTNEHRIRDHSRRNSNLDPGWKMEDVMRITVDGKSHHPQNLSKKKRMCSGGSLNP